MINFALLETIYSKCPMKKFHNLEIKKVSLIKHLLMNLIFIGLLFVSFSSVYAESGLDYIAVNNEVVKGDIVAVENTDIVKISVKKGDGKDIKISFAGKGYGIHKDGDSNWFTLISLQGMSDGLYPVGLLVDGKEVNTLTTVKVGEGGALYNSKGDVKGVSDFRIPKIGGGESVYSLVVLVAFVLVIISIFLSKRPKEDEDKTSK